MINRKSNISQQEQTIRMTMGKALSKIKNGGYKVTFCESDTESFLIEYEIDGVTHMIDSKWNDAPNKLCISCHKVKPRCDYYKATSSRDGMMSECKECTRVRHRNSNKKKIDKEIVETRRDRRRRQMLIPTTKTEIESKTKRCGTCKLYLTLDDFHRNSSKPDGLHTECKKCKAKRDNQNRAHNKEVLSSPVTEVVQGERIIWKGEKYVHLDYATGIMSEPIGELERDLKDAKEKIAKLQDIIISIMTEAK